MFCWVLFTFWQKIRDGSTELRVTIANVHFLIQKPEQVRCYRSRKGAVEGRTGRSQGSER